jgi:hypothetical protein
MTRKSLDKIAARQRAELYCQSHPGSPSAVRSPKIFAKSGVWVALLGRSVTEGIAGFGPTVEAALRSFDQQYLLALRTPTQDRTFDQAA